MVCTQERLSDYQYSRYFPNGGSNSQIPNDEFRGNFTLEDIGSDFSSWKINPFSNNDNIKDEKWNSSLCTLVL